MNDYDYMLLALKEAKKAYKINEAPIGAVIVYKDVVISKAYNKREKEQNVTRHAEMIAIEKACKKINSWRLEECTLYVTLEPCLMCAGAIQQARIKRVVYGASDLKAGALGGLFNVYDIEGLNHYPVVSRETLDGKCSSIIKEFFQNLRKSKVK